VRLPLFLGYRGLFREEITKILAYSGLSQAAPQTEQDNPLQPPKRFGLTHKKSNATHLQLQCMVALQALHSILHCKAPLATTASSSYHSG
jgi:hypothetical protein